MKSTVKVGLFLLFGLFISQGSYGQSFLDKVKQKTKEKIEKRLDDKVDEQIDKGLDKVENSIDSLGSGESGNDDISREAAMQNRMSSMLQGMGMSGDPVPIENSYSFTKLVQMHIEMYDNEEKKTSNGEFITHLNPDNGSLAYEVVSDDRGDNDQGLFIVDTKNKAMILLNDKGGEKTGVVYGMGTFFEDIENKEDTDNTQADEDIEDVKFQHPEVKQTGKTKNIAGYKCQQYLYNTEDVDSEFWITDELKTSERDFFGTLFKTSAMTNGMGYGYVMESVSKDKASGNINKMQVTRVDNNARSTYNLSSYQITNLGTFSMPAGNQ